jgi:hypothetical protein
MKHRRGRPIGRELTPLGALSTPLPSPVPPTPTPRTQPPEPSTQNPTSAPASVPDPAHRRTICVWLPRFRSEVEARVRPDPLGRPIAVFDPTRRARPLLDASCELRVASYEPDDPTHSQLVGLALREAETRWPDVAYRADAPAEYARALEPLLELLAELSPTVEWRSEPAEAAAAVRHAPPARYAIFLDGTGLAALYGSEERLARLIVRELADRAGLVARVGIADGRYAALHAATSAISSEPPHGKPERPAIPARGRAGASSTLPPLSRGRDVGAGPERACEPKDGRAAQRRGPGGEGHIVPPGHDAAFLAPLPVALLPLPPESCARVASLGAQSLADFARLPANALRHRFGPDGVTARALAAGHDEGPLRARPTPLQLHDTIDLEWVETSLDRLLFLLKRLADRLSVRLGHHGLGCGRLRVHWLLDDSGLTTGDDLIDTSPPPTAPGGAQCITPAGGEGLPGAITSIVRLAEPAGSGAGLLEHLRWHVEGLRPETFRDPDTGQMRGVRGIAVEAEELAPLSGRQLALLPGEDGRIPTPERLLAAERVLARLQARWGEAAVRQAEPVASRRPERAFRWRETGWAFQLPGAEPERGGGQSRLTRTPRPSVRRGKPPAPSPSPRLSSLSPIPYPLSPIPPPLWLMGQPEAVEVDCGGRLPNGRRRSGTIQQQGRRARRIVRAAGPWRLVEHWAAEPVARDAYHVVLADGTACWLVHDRLDERAEDRPDEHDERWYLFGAFD